MARSWCDKGANVRVTPDGTLKLMSAVLRRQGFRTYRSHIRANASSMLSASCFDTLGCFAASSSMIRSPSPTPARWESWRAARFETLRTSAQETSPRALSERDGSEAARGSGSRSSRGGPPSSAGR